ncbi:MAG: hypothetical protein J4F30_09630 [Acidobacteria bacterium]|nr:hypothetical protein [Acidobacteriota bacterium]
MTGPILIAASLLLAASLLAVAGTRLLVEMRRQRLEQAMQNLLATLGPALAAGRADPEALVAWAAVARTARGAFPEASARLDEAAGGRFPFSNDLIEAAHARWTADWLAWERQHDVEYKERTAAAEQALDAAPRDEAAACQLRLAAINQEKLQTYQERYEHYVRVGKAIGAIGGELEAAADRQDKEGADR